MPLDYTSRRIALRGVSGARGVSPPGPAGAPPTHALLRTTIEIAPDGTRVQTNADGTIITSKPGR